MIGSVLSNNPAFFDLLMSLFVFGGVLCAVWLLNNVFDAISNDLPETFKESMDNSGQYIFGGRLGYSQIFSLSMTAGIILSVVIFLRGGSIFTGPFILMLALGLPILLINQGDRKYRKALELVLPAALQQVANEMSSGRSLEKALEEVTESAPKPADIELGALQRKVASMGMERALEETAQKLQIPSFSLAASVLNVGSKQGGNLINALKRLSTTLVEIERMNRKIRTASESGRRMMMIMSFFSLLFPFFWYTSGPVKFEVVLSNPLGQAILLGAFLIWVLAVGLAIIVIRVKV
ncbi:MAG: type II secretion system F family protein [Hyphomicrobiales bacterium]